MIIFISNQLPSFKQKKPFLLMEVLLALFLVSLCLVPLIRSPLRNYRQELQLLKASEGERWAEWSFSEIKEKILCKEIAWDKLPSEENTSPPFSLPPITLTLPGVLPTTIERTFTLHCKKHGEKQTKNQEIYRLLRIDLYFSPQLSCKTIKKNQKGDYSFYMTIKKQ